MYATPFASIQQIEDCVEEHNLRDGHPDLKPKWVGQEYDIEEGCYFIDLGDGQYFDRWMDVDLYNGDEETLTNNYVANRTRDEWHYILTYYLAGNPDGPYWPEGQKVVTRLAINHLWSTDLPVDSIWGDN